MQTLVCIEPGVVEYRSAGLPVLKPGHAIVRIKRVGICGTDIHAFGGTQPFFEYPRILGHELAGDVIEADKTGNLKPGDAVTILPYFNCGECMACRSGKPNCCVRLQVLGVHIDGGMAEYIQVPSGSLIRATGLDYDALSLVEPLSIGAHAVSRAAMAEGQTVLVMGAGPIGLAVMDFARIAGAVIIAMDVNLARLQFCRDTLRADYVVDPAREKAEDRLLDITSGSMPAVVVDATGNLQALNQGFHYMSHGGTYVLVGLQKDEIRFSHPAFHKREGTLMSSRNALRKDFERVIRCIQEEKINPKEYITGRVAFRDIEKESKTLLGPPSGAGIKTLVEMG